DIFSLPDVFLRDLMKTVEIKDRLRLRLTCRAFEKLVAESHAGYFHHGGMHQAPVDNSFKFYIGVAHFKDIEASDEGFRQCINLRNRLFSGIELESFSVNFGDDATVLSKEFIRKFTQNFKIDHMTFLYVLSLVQLSIIREMMSWFPQCKADISLYFWPGSDVLQSLPPLKALSIFDSNTDYDASNWPWQIDSALFFDLLSKHTCLNLNNVSILSGDLERTVLIISDERREKNIQILVKKAIVAEWLKSHRIFQSYKKGDRHGQYEVASELGQRTNMGLRYTKATSRPCLIEVLGNVWEEGNTHINMKNVE
ncbi:hypothetical protein PMAYCL1PPCAC_22244, partial [Pristionchus mayeri]